MGAITSDNLTAVLYGANDLRLEQRPISEISDNEILLRMEVVGICGSDVHYFTNGRLGHNVIQKPMVVGHEGSATVVKVGKSVTNFGPGDRVAIEPQRCCRTCVHCKHGSYNLCPQIKFCACPPTDGFITRYFAHIPDFCYKLPENVSFEEGALIEPLSVAVHACKRGSVSVGSKVLILGSGPIGLAALLCAKAFGATKVVITDVVRSRLNIAETLGADAGVLVEQTDSENEVVKKIVLALDGQPDISLECSGAEQSIRTAIHATQSGGSVVLVGVGKQEATVPLVSALRKEVNLIGSFRYANDYSTALELVASGKVDAKPLVTNHFKMEDSLKAFQVAKTGEGGAIKVLIHTNPEWKS